MQCDKCGSDNTQRLEVAFQSGTSDTNATSHSAGLGIAGLIGFGGVVTKTQGTSQSVLAQRVAPPLKKSNKVAIIFIVVGILLLRAPAYMGFFLAAVGAVWYYTNNQFNKQRWPAMYQDWATKWVCLKCGNIYSHTLKCENTLVHS